MKAFDIFQNVLIQNTNKILSKKKTSCSQILDWQDLCVHPLCDCERIQSTVAASNPFYALSLVFILSPIQFHLFLFYWHKRTWASTATTLIPSPADVCVMEVDFLWSVRWSETDRPHLIDLLHLHCQSLTYQTPSVFIIRWQLKKYSVSLINIYCVWHHTNSVSHSYCFFHSLLAIACSHHASCPHLLAPAHLIFWSPALAFLLLSSKISSHLPQTCHCLLFIEFQTITHKSERCERK